MGMPNGLENDCQAFEKPIIVTLATALPDTLVLT